MSAPKPTEWKKFEYKAPGISITGGTKRGKNKATTGTATKSGTSKKPAASLPTPATTTSSHSLEKTDLEKVVSGWLNGLNDNDDKPDESTSGLCETIAQIGGKFKASETTLEKKENKSKTTISQPLHKNATAFSGKPSPKRAKLNGSARNDSQRGFSQTGSAVEIISDGSEDSDGEVLHSIRPPSVPGPRYQEPPKAQRRTTVPRKKPSTKAKLSIVDVDALPDSNTPQPKTKSSNSKEISPIHSWVSDTGASENRGADPALPLLPQTWTFERRRFSRIWRGGLGILRERLSLLPCEDCGKFVVLHGLPHD